MKELAATLIGVPLDDRGVRVAASLLLSSRHSIRAITRFIKRRALLSPSQRGAPCATKDPPSASRDCVLICPISQQAVQRSGRSWGLPFMTSARLHHRGQTKHYVIADRLPEWNSERESKFAKFCGRPNCKPLEPCPHPCTTCQMPKRGSRRRSLK